MSLPDSENTETEATNESQCKIPPKSREKYMQAYYNFIEWKKSKKADSFAETVFLNYFKELAEDRQPSTLWSTYSMLKPTVSLKNNINMKTFKNLSAYLKKMAKGHKSRKSNVLTSQEVETFLKEAPDKHYLVTKVALVLGIEGACRGNELLKVTVDDIEENSDQLLFVKMTDSKTNKDKSFTIRHEYRSIVEKYQELRPDDIKTKRFFIRYQNGKCMKQVIGKNRFSVMAQEIASYLKLSDVLFYTGHCFRRTSAILLPKPAGDQSVPKKPDDQNSEKTGEEKTEESKKESMEKKAEISESTDETMTDSANPPLALSPRPSTSKNESSPLRTEQTIISDSEKTLNTENINESTTISVPNKTATNV